MQRRVTVRRACDRSSEPAPRLVEAAADHPELTECNRQPHLGLDLAAIGRPVERSAQILEVVDEQLRRLPSDLLREREEMQCLLATSSLYLGRFEMCERVFANRLE